MRLSSHTLISTVDVDKFSDPELEQLNDMIDEYINNFKKAIAQEFDSSISWEVY